MSLNTIRHDAVFDKRTFESEVQLIGAGSVGSHVAMQLSKLGVGTHPNSMLHLYDGDTLESHNVGNQAYDTVDIGRLKVEALEEACVRWSNGIKPVAHPHFVRDAIPLQGVVMTCVDSMEVRKNIGETSIWGNPSVQLLIDARMDVNTAVVFVVDPNNKRHVALWNEYWFPDALATDAPGCGGNQVVIDSVLCTAALAVRQLIRFARGENERPNYVRLSLDTGEYKVAYW